MDLNEHALRLGKLLANLQSLELVIRLFLQRDKPLGVPPGTNLFAYPVGAVIPLNEITSYDGLGRLIRRYNREMNPLGKPTIDETIVDLRDALAHGRVSSEATGPEQLRLVKFSEPKNNNVTVMFNEPLTEEWFTIQIRRVVAALMDVHRTIENVPPTER